MLNLVILGSSGLGNELHDVVVSQSSLDHPLDYRNIANRNTVSHMTWRKSTMNLTLSYQPIANLYLMWHRSTTIILLANVQPSSCCSILILKKPALDLHADQLLSIDRDCRPGYPLGCILLISTWHNPEHPIRSRWCLSSSMTWIDTRICFQKRVVSSLKPLQVYRFWASIKLLSFALSMLSINWYECVP